MNYEETMVSVFHELPLPIHYMQIDSWWYYKGTGDGVSEWSARPDIFPDGLATVYRRMENIPMAAHNRYWAANTFYAEKYAFVFDAPRDKALPVSNDSFWLDLLGNAHREWGLILYEQDWMNAQTINVTPLLADIHLGHRWLTSMSAAADQVGVNIQYCISLPRHALHIMQKNSRPQWNIGMSSMLAAAVGVAPFKDVLWSTVNEPDAPYPAPVMEPIPDREILIATLSTGPVAPGDGIDCINMTRIIRCCREDGLILKPDRPITMINTLVADWAQHSGGIQGELYSTQSTLSVSF
jgi:hypothetical protein